MADAELFSDAFVIDEVNDEKYDRVSRITATSTDRHTALTLDVNTDLYPLSGNDTVTIALASTLSLDGSKDDNKGWRDVRMGEQTLADEYDYVCHGKIYRFMEGDGDGDNMYEIQEEDRFFPCVANKL